MNRQSHASAEMADAIWNALQVWVKICRCQCYNDKLSGKNLFVAPMGQQLTDFLKASGGSPFFEINQEEVDRKRGIIGVDLRSSPKTVQPFYPNKQLIPTGY